MKEIEDAALRGGEAVEAWPARGVGHAEALEGGQHVASDGSVRAALREEAAEFVIRAKRTAHIELDQAVPVEVAVDNDWTTLGEAWFGARPLVLATLEQRERSFADLVREKAARRIGVTVLDGAAEDVA